MRTTRSTITIIGLIIAILAIIGIMALMSSPYGPENRYENRYPDQDFMYPSNMPFSGNQDLKTEFNSNGERIYYTAINETGQRIEFSGGPHWLYVHGGSCVDCHGVDGRGGVPIMMGFEVPSDITYEALTSREHNEGEHEEHPPYTDESIKIAIRDGIDPSGEALDITMPRWKMSEKDLNDTVEYLKTL